MNSLRRILFASVALIAALPAFGQVVYCTAIKPTSVPGCVPALTASDLTLATGSWEVTSLPMSPGETGANAIFIYTNVVGGGQSAAVPVQLPFGTLCIGSNFKRTTPPCPFLPFFAPPNSCVASISLPINCNAGALGINVGDDVNVQCWYRDKAVFASASFTHAMWYTVQ